MEQSLEPALMTATATLLAVVVTQAVTLKKESIQRLRDKLEAIVECMSQLNRQVCEQRNLNQVTPTPEQRREIQEFAQDLMLFFDKPKTLVQLYFPDLHGLWARHEEAVTTLAKSLNDRATSTEYDHEAYKALFEKTGQTHQAMIDTIIADYASLIQDWFHFIRRCSCQR